ncbi:hypothetical protein GW17_00062247, partial [Ensete ventricosum]
MHWVNVVGNSSGVRRELVQGIGSLPGWRKGVRQKKTETHQKIVGDSRKAYQERCSGISLKFIKRFAEGIRKLAGRYPEEDRKTHRKNAGGCQIGG